MSPNKPLVSVLVPLYNHEKYIVECLDSIRDEGWRPMELVIHDDCSTDNSLAIAQRWCESNKSHFASVKIEKALQNRGLVAALNYLVDLSSGDYVVCPLASDDALLPGGIQARLAALKQNPQWLAVFGDAVTIDGDSKKQSESYLFDTFHSNKSHLLSSRLRRMEILVRWSVPGPVILYRKAAFSESMGVGRYNENLCIEDRDMYLRLLTNNQLGFIDQAVARYRLHSNNTMNKPEIRIQSMIDRATPLLEIAEKSTLSRSERFVAKHTGKALKAHAMRRSSNSGAARVGYSVVRALRTAAARAVANGYFAFHKGQ